jgi:Ca2+-binding EF-hand superfamily protein
MQLKEVEIPLVGRHPTGRPFVAKPVLKPKKLPESKGLELTATQKARPNDLREYAERLVPKGIVKSECAAAVAVWEEPHEEFAKGAQLDFAEGLLLQRFQQIPEYVRNPDRPIVAVIAFFLKMERETIDFPLFEHVIKLLKLDSTRYVTELVSIGLFNRFDLDQVGSFSVEEFAYRLFKLRGSDFGSDASKAERYVARSCLARMREALAFRVGGFESLHNVARQFSSFVKKRPRGQFADVSSEAVINRAKPISEFGDFFFEEFERSIDSFYPGYGAVFSDEEKHILFKLNAGADGKVMFKDFVVGVRGKMSKTRRAAVQAIYDHLDKQKAGAVNVETIYSAYDASRELSVLKSVACAEDVAIRFMNTFDSDSTGFVTAAEFMEGYEWISASIVSDGFFFTMMSDAWGMDFRP